MIDPYHLEAYGKTTVNYNRDVEIFPVLRAMFMAVSYTHLDVYKRQTYDSVEREQYYIRSLGEQRIDGYIFVGTRSTDLKDSEHIIKLAKHKPVVMVYSDLSAYGVCSIVTDDVAAVSRVTKSLFEQGHQRVALFSSDVPHMTYLDKQHGYEQALEEIGRSDDAVICLLYTSTC